MLGVLGSRSSVILLAWPSLSLSLAAPGLIGLGLDLVGGFRVWGFRGLGGLGFKDGPGFLGFAV